jgi:hypothetical protein
MTISDEMLQPQDRSSFADGSSQHIDIEALVRTLADQAKAADERARAADERSQTLEQRVALLEGRQQQQQPVSRQSGFNFGNDIIDKTDAPAEHMVIGVPEKITMDIEEDDDDEAISNRIALIERRMDNFEDSKETLNSEEYKLPESTFSLLVTENPASAPFVFAVFSVALSILCLGLTLADAISKGTKGNRLGIA